MLAALIGTIFLTYKTATNFTELLISLIYGFSVTFLFFSSSMYHYFKKTEDEISIWRKVDHFSIFIMIAGSYTPISFIYLDGYWKWAIIILQWSLVLGGFFFKFYYLNAPRYLSTIIYLLMGWVGIIPIKYFIKSMSTDVLTLLFLGGLSFTVGAIFYLVKRPKLKKGFGFHEIFHLFILLGGFFHYLMVYIAVTK